LGDVGCELGVGCWGLVVGWGSVVVMRPETRELKKKVDV